MEHHHAWNQSYLAPGAGKNPDTTATPSKAGRKAKRLLSLVDGVVCRQVNISSFKGPACCYCEGVGNPVAQRHLQTSMTFYVLIVKGSLGGETSVLRTFRMSGKELVKERVSQRNS